MKNFIGLTSAAFIRLDSMTQWIIEKSVEFTDVGLLRISESVRAYAYLILSSQASARSGIVGNNLSSQASARSGIVGNTASALTVRCHSSQYPAQCYFTKW